MVDESNLPLTERGSALRGPAGWSSIADEGGEATPELMWPNSVAVYDKMRREDPQVQSVLRAVTLPIRRTGWSVDPNGAPDEVVQHVADDLGLPIMGMDPKNPLRTRDRFSWVEFLRLSLLMLPVGHAYFEQIYRIVDGKARIRKLGYRPASTISQIKVAADGGLVSIEQRASLDGKPAVMTVDRLVAFVNDREGGNWVGQSLLRPAYKNWLLKDRALRTQAMTLDRNGLGVPVYTAPEVTGKTTEETAGLQRKHLEAGKVLASALRAGEDSGAALPHGAELELMGVTGTLPSADESIRYHDEQIARAVLAHFLNLGTQTGSWALGSTLGDFFVLSLQTVAQQIADTVTQHVIEVLVDINWGETVAAPRIHFEEIGSQQAPTTQAIKDLIACRALSPDEPLEQFLRSSYGLPAADPDTRRQVPAQTNTTTEREEAP